MTKRGPPGSTKSHAGSNSSPTKLLRRGVHKSVAAIDKDIRNWIKNWNPNPTPFVWKKTAEEMLDSLARYIARIPGGSPELGTLSLTVGTLVPADRQTKYV